MSVGRQGSRRPLSKARSKGLEKQQRFCGQLEPTAAADRAGSRQPCCRAWLGLRRPICSPQQKLFLTVSLSCQSHPILSVNSSPHPARSIRFFDLRANGSLNARRGNRDQRERLMISSKVVALTQDLTADLPKSLANFGRYSAGSHCGRVDAVRRRDHVC